MTNKNIKEPNKILVDVYDIYEYENENYILDSLSYLTSEPFPVICEMLEEDYNTVRNHINKQLTILLTAYSLSDPIIYDNEEDFVKRTKEDGLSIASQSFLASPQTMIIDEEEIPVPEAMITGIVKNIECSYTLQNEDVWFSFYEAQIELFGTIINAVCYYWIWD